MRVPMSELGTWPVAGVDGAALLARGGFVVEPEAGSVLSGEISRTQLVHVRGTRIRLSPFRGAWQPPVAADADRDVGWLLLHVSGQSATRIDGVGARDAVGALRIARPGSRIEIVAGGPTERILLEFSLTAISAESSATLRRPTQSQPPLDPTALTRAVIAFASAIFARPPRRASADAFHAEHMLLSLVASALSGAEPSAPITVPQPDRPTASAPETDVDDHVYARAVAIVQQEFARPDIDSGDVADRLGVSRRRLQRIFAERETTVADQVRLRRLDVVAERLLADPAADVGEIAQHVGFGAVDSVRRAFLSRFGMTMSAYRKQHRER